MAMLFLKDFGHLGYLWDLVACATGLPCSNANIWAPALSSAILGARFPLHLVHFVAPGGAISASVTNGRRAFAARFTGLLQNAHQGCLAVQDICGFLHQTSGMA